MMADVVLYYNITQGGSEQPLIKIQPRNNTAAFILYTYSSKMEKYRR